MRHGLVVAVVLMQITAATSAAAAPVKAAVFPFELVTGNTSGYVDPEIAEAESKRLELITNKLVSLLKQSEKYALVDIAPLKDDVAKAAPLYECRGCEAELAKKVGASVAISGTVKKTSSVLISISLFVREVATGELADAMVVNIREDDDAGWQRGVRSLVRNRLLAKER